MNKAPVEALDGEKNQLSTMNTEAPGEILEEAGAIDKYRLPADYVSSILAMPIETTLEDIPYPEADNLAKLLGVTEEWLEEERQKYKEHAARMQRNSNVLALLQDKVREELARKGYVEVDEEYLTNVAKMQEYSNELWKDQDWGGIEFSDPNDPDYVCWYEDL